jgi:hypothetical protein
MIYSVVSNNLGLCGKLVSGPSKCRRWPNAALPLDRHHSHCSTDETPVSVLTGQTGHGINNYWRFMSRIQLRPSCPSLVSELLIFLLIRASRKLRLKNCGLLESMCTGIERKGENLDRAWRLFEPGELRHRRPVGRPASRQNKMCFIAPSSRTVWAVFTNPSWRLAQKCGYRWCKICCQSSSKM